MRRNTQDLRNQIFNGKDIHQRVCDGRDRGGDPRRGVEISKGIVTQLPAMCFVILTLEGKLQFCHVYT